MRLSSEDLFNLTGDIRGLASSTEADSSRSIASTNSQDMKRFDVLKYYDEHLSGPNGNSKMSSSLFLGGLDTGMEIGKFQIDTTNNINNNSSNFTNDQNQSSQE